MRCKVQLIVAGQVFYEEVRAIDYQAVSFLGMLFNCFHSNYRDYLFTKASTHELGSFAMMAFEIDSLLDSITVFVRERLLK